MSTTATHIAIAHQRTQERAPKPVKTTAAIYTESILAMTLLFVVGVGVPTWIGYNSVSAGLALGLFSAFWGGPGFGVMAAGARMSLQTSDENDH